MEDAKSNSEVSETSNSQSVPSETFSPIEKAENILKQIQETEKRVNEAILKQEQIASRMLLQGRAEAGQQQAKSYEQLEKERIEAEVKANLARYYK